MDHLQSAIPIMDDGMKKQLLPHNLKKLLPVCCAIFSLALIGCQPQTRTGGLFGIGSSGSNTSASSAFSGSAFNNPFGGASNNQSATFTPSSPFGNFAQSSGGGFQLPSRNLATSGSGTQNFDPSGLGQLGQPGIAQEYSRIQQQIGAYDADNQLLNTEVATLQQKLELANQYNLTLKQQLADTSDRVSQSGNQARINEQQFASMQQQVQALQQRLAQQEQLLAQQERALAQRREEWQGNTALPNTNFDRNNTPFRNTGFDSSRGSATLRANNGLMRKLEAIDIPGGNARMDGDIIRIEFPTDRLFTSGSYRIQPSQLPLLQNIVSTIRQSFPRQIVGIEAHWDGTPLNPPGTTDHQLTATQSLAVFDELVRLGLPRQQLFTMALASNRPRHRQQLVNGISPNRRVELVIYPESYDGS